MEILKKEVFMNKKCKNVFPLLLLSLCGLYSLDLLAGQTATKKQKPRKTRSSAKSVLLSQNTPVENNRTEVENTSNLQTEKRHKAPSTAGVRDNLPPLTASVNSANIFRPKQKKIYWQFRFASGLATFPDVQTPQNLYLEENGRADGSVVGSVSSQHSSIPLDVTAIYHYKLNQDYKFSSGFDYLYLTNYRGNPDTAHSSYSSTDLNFNIDREWQHSFASVIPSLGLGLNLGRSRYMNVSTGHFNDAISPVLRASVENKRIPLRFTFLGSYALWSQFKYYPGNIGTATTLSGTKVQQYALKAGAEYQITSDASIDLSLFQQVTKVDIANVATYKRFGLTVASYSDNEHLNLATLSVQCGVSKFF